MHFCFVFRFQRTRVSVSWATRWTCGRSTAVCSCLVFTSQTLLPCWTEKRDAEKICLAYSVTLTTWQRVAWKHDNFDRLSNVPSFYGPPDGSQRAIMFLPCPSVRPSSRPSIRPWGQFFFCLKTRFMGFWEGLWCFWRFRFLSVRACVRACVRYALCTKFCGLNLS